MANAALTHIRSMIAEWQNLRAQICKLEQAEHPDIVDRHGRAWTRRAGTLYTHDDTLSLPADMIHDSGLPPAGLADRNPNYTRLCNICRHDTGH